MRTATSYSDFPKARLTRAIKGRVIHWRKGRVVRVSKTPGVKGYTISRLRWIGGPENKICNVCVAVPADALEFLK